MIYTIVNLNFYWYLLQKLLLVNIISRFLGQKLWKILRICVRSFLNPHPDALNVFLPFWNPHVLKLLANMLVKSTPEGCFSPLDILIRSLPSLALQLSRNKDLKKIMFHFFFIFFSWRIREERNCDRIRWFLEKKNGSTSQKNTLFGLFVFYHYFR